MEGYLIHQVKIPAGMESWCLTANGLVRFYHHAMFGDFVIAHNCHLEVKGNRLMNVELNQRLPLSAKQRVLLLYLHELLFRAKDFFCDNERLLVEYKSALMRLLNSDNDWHDRKILRQFEILLLKLAGFAIDFSRDTDQQALHSEQYYDYSADCGFTTGARYSGKILMDLADSQFTSKEHFKSIHHILKETLPSIIGQQDINTRQLWHLLK